MHIKTNGFDRSARNSNKQIASQSGAQSPRALAFELLVRGIHVNDASTKFTLAPLVVAILNECYRVHYRTKK
jgi:hypothetical protein